MERRKKKKKKLCLYDTDRVAKNLWLNLLRDFRLSEGKAFCSKAEAAFLAGIKSFREYSFPELGEIRPGRFKRYAQLEACLKKYRFANDAYTDDELEQMTIDKYFDNQKSLCSGQPLGLSGYVVCRTARKIARRILGKYDPNASITLARFGKKSSIGCPLNLAYIDEKLSNVKAFTGSSECSRWFFNDVLSSDSLLKSIIHQFGLPTQVNQSKELEHNSLTLINVPKTWKTHRTITPLTLLSLFYSYGIGEQVTERLKLNGLNISTLQQKHRRLVAKFSVTKNHATADLTSASDSLTSELLNRILPRDWYCAIKKAITHQVVVNNNDVESKYYTASVLPMGNGFTFPLETLIFYCIIKAIGELANIKGIYSVYGDDLIYPSKLHKYVVAVFPQLRLCINKKKTYVSSPFRESCGSDYYRGCDVRPFFLQGTSEQLTASKYLAFLYKTYNGLTRRWDESEIRNTLQYLLIEIAGCTKDIFRIPPSYPDTAGIKVDCPGLVPLGASVLPWASVKVLFTHGSRSYSFRFLHETSNRRYVKSVEPYYWLALQRRNDDIPLQNFWDTDFSFLDDAPMSSLSWEKQIRKRTYWKNKRRVTKEVVMWKATVASRNSSKVTVERSEPGSISDWL